MQAFHSFWSQPNRIVNAGPVNIPDCELLVLMLSALKWKQLNGPIKMITDKAGKAYFEENGFADLWSEPMDDALEKMNGAINPYNFWAAGKLMALSTMKCPCVMLDTDVIIWENMDPLWGDAVIAAHEENLGGNAYADPSCFRLKEGYAFPPSWDFSVQPANTAFLYMPSDDLKAYYVESAFAFMRAAANSECDPVVSMCFAEQRVLPMCIKSVGMQLAYLMDSVEEMHAQNFITHVWGYKRVLAESSSERHSFCRRCMRRILHDFPEWRTVLEENSRLSGYIEN